VATSIAARLVALLTLSASLVLGASLLLDYRLSRDNMLQELVRDAEASVGNVVSDLDNWLGNIENSTELFAGILAQQDFSLPQLDRMLRQVVLSNEDIFGATIAVNPALLVDLPDGFAPYYFRGKNGIERRDLATAQNNYPAQPWFSEAVAQGRPLWVEPYLDSAGAGVLMTTYSVPVYRLDPEGGRQLFAVLTADVTLEELRGYLHGLRLGDSGFGLLLSRGGLVLSFHDPAMLLQPFMPLLQDNTDRHRWQRLVEAGLRRETLTDRLSCPRLFGSCTVRMSSVPATGWPVAVVFSEDEVLAPLRQYRLRFAGSALLTLLVLALVIGLVTRRLTRPLGSLTRAIEGVAHGDLSITLPPAPGGDEVARLVNAFGAMQGDLKSYIAELEAATASRSRLEGELSAAREIQLSMLPGGGTAAEDFGRCRLWAQVRPARAVGGDLYSYQLSQDLLCLALGDVSDKGVPAALFMARALSFIQQYADVFLEPPQGMARLNNALEEGNENCMFLTLFFAVLDLRNLQLRFCSAGHPEPVLLRDGTVSSLPQDVGPALGLARDLAYPLNVLQLQAGDRLVIYSDGIDEAFNEDNEMFGVERLQQALQGSRGESTAAAGEQLLASVDRFAGARPQSDDITVLVVDLPEHAEGPAYWHTELASGEHLAGRAMAWVTETLASLGVDRAIARDLVLVTEEVTTNIDKYAELPTGATVRLELLRHGQGLTLRCSDPGLAFDPLTQAREAELGADIESAEVGGLGIHLIRSLTDGQHYSRSDGRNILSLEKHLRTHT
jgi:sigma-B regulation protein RsbU (phosphoserine phosphatase)